MIKLFQILVVHHTPAVLFDRVYGFFEGVAIPVDFLSTVITSEGEEGGVVLGVLGEHGGLFPLTFDRLKSEFFVDQ